jgi:hypothetical protein
MRKTTHMCMLLAAICILGFQKTYAQFDKENLSLGGGLAFFGYAGTGSTLAINLRGNYNMDEKSSVVVGYNFHLPISYDYQTTVVASSSSVTPSQMDVKTTDKVNIHNIFLNYHRYFVGDNEESLGIYGLAGVGLTFASLSTEYESYDQSKYNLNSGGASVSVSGFIIDLGLGANFNMERLAIFGELKGGIPANQANNTLVYNPIPFHYSVTAGVRYTLFQ